MAELDTEIRAKSDSRSSLDDVLLAIATSENAITLGEFDSIAGQFTGDVPHALRAANLPGCEIR